MTVEPKLLSDRLPTYLTRFVGREQDIADVTELLQANQLVTVCGVGGSGKTRLAIEVARNWHLVTGSEEVYWVSLAAVSEPIAVTGSVAAAVGLPEAASSDPMPALVNALLGDSVLVVIDNCEHLVRAACELIGHLCAACPQLTVLTTSRAALQAEQECVFPIPPLESADAADLFVERAAAVSPVYAATEANTATIARICEWLDDLPLAIELAATWIQVLSANDLLSELDKSVDVLSSSALGVEDRHRSMRAVLDRSWEWLGQEERRVFAKLGVFLGGFTQESAEVVAGASLASLAALTERSLISRLPDPSGGGRYEVHELLRTYALERLEEAGGAAATARAAHADYFLDLVEQAEAVWDTADEDERLNRLATDEPNVDSALRWALALADSERALRLSASLFAPWIYSSPLARYAELVEQAVQLPWDASSTATLRSRAKAHNVVGYEAIAEQDFQRAESRFSEAIELYGILEQVQPLAWTHRGYGYTHLVLRGDLQTARAHVDRSLALCRGIGDERGLSWSTHDLGEIAMAAGDLEGAQQMFEQALPEFERLGVWFGAYRGLVALGEIHLQRNEWLAAAKRFRSGLEVQRRMHYTGRGADLLDGVAGLAEATHRHRLAARLYGAGDTWFATFRFTRYHRRSGRHRHRNPVTARQLSDEEWNAEFDRGARLSVDQAQDAVEAALSELEATYGGRLPVGLTDRELDVLRLVAQGFSNDAIANRLVVSPRTVHAHLRSIFDKLGVSTRAAAAHEAARLNLVFEARA
jgi:predicted ATPase/DNA-binding CsgD family transcriptional regulator